MDILKKDKRWGRVEVRDRKHLTDRISERVKAVKTERKKEMN